ncbi:CHAP domain-containing protein [Nocardioides mesophilus]|uniref:CHAP domain-containing protein n=1 Tax=Nocardioides mesophilus TaxID=433659 RepID=A0A7G9RCY2_9ACTN|nr:CHAP domain-containing protein [Nocardioides mesophilus]QNN53457.1 CHAP domain-containing protein [Nocardioides mesophilus]
MSHRSRLVGALTSLMLALSWLAGPLSAPASADSTRLCLGYSACARAGMSSAGYASVSSTMYWRMYSGHNCTNYAAYRMVKSGLPNTRPWSGSGNATNWGSAMASITDATPRVGAVAWWKAGVWPAGSAGHVAYVEQVVSATEIVVSQDSWGGDFSWARITKSGRGWPSGFVHFNDVALRSTTGPTITGVAKVGSVLTATAGTWSPVTPTLSYQWLADGADIPGATSATFTPAPDLEGSTIAVRVTASALGYAVASATSAGTAAVLPGQLVNTVPPVVSGDPVVDGTVTATSGQWSPTPDRVNLKWYADGVAVRGATSPSLAVGPDLVGKSLTVRATARREGYDLVRLNTGPVGPVDPGTFAPVETPSITGVPRLAEPLALEVPAATPDAESVVVEWQRDGARIDGATAPTYQLTAEDLGARIRGVLTYARPGYTPLRTRTAATGVVRSEPVMRLRAVPGTGKVKVVVKVSAAAVAPVEGLVRIWSGGRLLAQLPLVEGRARSVTRDLPAGERTLRVRYLGSRTVAAADGSSVVTIG